MNTYFYITFYILSSVVTFNAPASSLTETQKLYATDGFSGSVFGSSVAIDGELAAIGRSPGSVDAGSVYLYEHNNNQWTELQKLIPSDGFINDSCGKTVAIDGLRVVVGCPSRNLGNVLDVGAVYVFDFDGIEWVETEKIVGPSNRRGGGGGSQFGEGFGFSISLEGNRLAIGAPNSGSTNSPGGIYVYEFDGISWSQTETLRANDVTNRTFLGWSVDLNGDRIVSGATRDQQAGALAGAAYVFEFDGLGWQQVQKILPLNQLTQSFGSAVGQTVDTVVVSAINDSVEETAAGAVYVFEQNSLAQWTQVIGLYASDALAFDRIGRQVSVTEGNILVAKQLSNLDPRPGSAYLFKKYGSGWREAKIIQSDENVIGELFAMGVAVSNNKILISATLADDATTVDTGAVFTFINDLIFNNEFE